jgi:hypothetical protein
MRKLLFLLILFPFAAVAQLHLGLFGGISNYQGDLTDKLFVGKLTRPAIGITGSYELSSRFMLRGGFTYAQLAGSDRYISKDYLKLRNLGFESDLVEVSLLGEFYTFDMDSRRWSPYVFGGLAVYHYNPYVLTTENEKVFLKPLSTEGQGLPQYPEQKPYSLTQFALPFGGGIKYALSDRVRIGAEIGIRKLFTDYLDDVSTNYADENDLIAERGEIAAALAYRGDEVPGGNPVYPLKGEQRGSAQQKDLYYLTGLTVSFRLGDGGLGGGGGGRRKGYGCPKVPQ